MTELSKEELKCIEGGANWLVIGAVTAGIISFISGILSGYSNPTKCHN